MLSIWNPFIAVVAYQAVYIFRFKVLKLVANQKWREVVQYCDENSLVWQQPGMPHHNITTVLNIYCTYLAEKQPGQLQYNMNFYLNNIQCLR